VRLGKQHSLRERALAGLVCATMLSASPAGLTQTGTQTGTPPAQTQQQTPEAPPAKQPKDVTPSIAEQAKALSGPIAPFHVDLPRSRNPFAAYMASTVAPLNLNNSPRLDQLVRDGKLYLSLKEALALALEDNLDLAYFRYNLPIADTDLLRTKAGGIANGVNVGTVQGSAGGSSGAFGAGGASGGAGSTNGGAGSSAGGGAGGLVQSTLGLGTTVHSRDPQFYMLGYTDHTTTQLTNSVTTGGVAVYQQNTIEAQTEYSQYFALGTNIQFYYTGLRQTTNSAATNVNPLLQSNFQLFINQPLLAGFGLATNTRYLHIAKNNRTLTDLGFKSQVIATITQVENIYWDLVNAYEDEQVKERSLQFAQKTLDDDRKQLDLQAIPAMQVMKDESDVATREGDLTVAKATLKLNELYIKNALTKTAEDPRLEDMPVVPTDRSEAIGNDVDQPIEDLIARAQKNRPDLAMDQLSMETAKISLNAVKNELLPSLTLYGELAGVGNAGLPNPDCVNCPRPTVPNGYFGSLQNAFNYSSPEYQVGFQLQLTIRNRIAKADQFRSVLEYRQRELQFEQQKKGIRFDVRNSQFALQQARAHVDAARKARDLMQRTFDITKQEQQLGAKSSFDTLSAEHDLAVSESALVASETAFEKAKVDLDRAVGTTLEHNEISIDDAKTGIAADVRP
jgi:outer membrane protein TolC